MQRTFLKLRGYLKEFTPQTLTCLQEGYTLNTFWSDLFAGACVGIIAIPLALAFAIASGVAPEQGLYTAIVAGFIISLLGGSRVQIGGPTGAFVILVYSIVAQFGYEGLACATLIAGCLVVLMGLARLGSLLKFIPHPVIVGFTTGIACVIFTSQVRDFFGLPLAALPPEFIDKWVLYLKSFSTTNGWAFSLAAATLCSIFLFRKYFPRLPGAMIAIVGATCIALFFELPVETVGSKFGQMPRLLPKPTFPHFSYSLFVAVFPSALTVAFLAALESLLSASIADGLFGGKHRSNIELIAQGLANLGSVFFGGIPATGAIARTTANIKLGARTPISGLIHAATILILMLFLAPLVGKIPLAALAGVLVFVAWNMSELPHFIEILRGPKGDALPLALTFVMTLLFDLTVAIEVGVILSAIIFLKRMTDKTAIKPTETQPSEIAFHEIQGPFFYSVAHLLDETLSQWDTFPKVFVLGMQQTPLIDSTGLRALRKFHQRCQQHNILFIIAGAKPDLFKQSKFAQEVGNHHFFPSTESALAYARQRLSPSDSI